MRAYYFGNLYLSSIQQGIQAAHATHEMFTNWRDSGSTQNRDLWDWAENHKTMILLNAGYSDTIRELIERFESPENPFAWAPFYEGQDSLDGALTTVGIVLPEYIYESAAYIRSVPFRIKEDVIQEVTDTGRLVIKGENGIVRVGYDLTEWEFNLVQELNNYGLAR